MQLNNLPVTDAQRRRLNVLFKAFNLNESIELNTLIKSPPARIQPEPNDDNKTVEFTIKEITFYVAHNIITVHVNLISRRQFEIINASEDITYYFIHCNKNLNLLEINIYD
jgi:hypothetical protein